MGEENKEEEKKEGKEEKKEEEPQEIVLEVAMHCERCARKVERTLMKSPEVEDITTDIMARKLVVKGKTADLIKMFGMSERIQEKIGRKVKIISPLPKPPEENKEENKEPQEEKEEELGGMRKAERTEDGQASQAGNNTSSREERFKSVMDAKVDYESESETPKRRIPKVPFMLRGTKDFKNNFEPRVVSIGPYHHGNDEFKLAEKLKLRFTKLFIKNKQEEMVELYDKILKKMKELRDCYEEEPTKKYDDEELAWMLFVDGCSLLHYIDCYTNGKLKKWKIFKHHVAFVHRDMFLLENQLPFQLLELLMSARFKNIDEGMKMMEKFIQMSIKTHGRKGMEQKPQQTQDRPEMHSHLLDLLRKRLVGKRGQTNNQGQQANNHPRQNDSREDDHWHSFRNVMELRLVGIHLKPSKTNCLNDVSFQPGIIHGKLKIPRIVVDDSTRPKLLNLIAFEMSPGIDNDSEVISYICFLDSLIDHPDDVKELRAKRILYNLLGSDEEVATLFNEIGTDLVPNSNIYKEVKQKIQKHYDGRGRSYVAQLIRDHFSSPITFLAFIVGLFIILLSIVQTIFAIIGPLSGECDRLCKSLKNK